MAVNRVEVKGVEPPVYPLWRGTLIVLLVEHEIGNLCVTSSSPALGTGRYGPPVHPVVKWVPVIWKCLAS